jgi:hypothetical protein
VNIGRESGPTEDFAVTVAIDGVASEVAEYARTKIGGLARYAHGPVLHARVRLSHHRDPVGRTPVIGQANIDVGGRLVRAQVQAHTAREAVDLLDAKLRHRLERVAEHWEARRGRVTTRASIEWHHDSEPTLRPNCYPRPAEQRRIIRRKSFSMTAETVDEAITEMEVLGYDFHLFTERGSGATSVVYRGGPSGYRLALLTPELIGQLSPYERSVVVSPHPAPCLTDAEATKRLNLLDTPFLFFIDAAEGRACVLYRRYDGHYGLITPAD